MHRIRTIAPGGTGTWTYTPNPHIMKVEVEGCLPTHQLTIVEFYTRVYSKVEFTYGKDCKFIGQINTP